MGTWFSIVQVISDPQKLNIDLADIVSCNIGSSENTLFWLEDWTGHGSFASRFPCLYELDKRNYCFVAERLSTNAVNWNWKQLPKDNREVTDLRQLESILNQIDFNRSPDKWQSKLSSDGAFYVHNLRALIDKQVTKRVENHTVWISLVPIKVNAFVWRASMDRIPSTVALSRRGIFVQNSSCHICDKTVWKALITSLLGALYMARDCLSWILNWCNITYTHFHSVGDLVKFAATWDKCLKKRRILLAISYGYLWCMWKARNDKVFNNTRTSPSKLADNILTLVFNWIKHRGKKWACKWEDWICYPLNVL